MAESKRIDWIDAAKGFLIITVVLQHAGIPRNIDIFLHSFRMPFYFFLSGLVFNPFKNTNFYDFSLKKAKAFVAPYFWFSFIYFFILWMEKIFLFKSFPKWVIKFDPWQSFLAVLYGEGSQKGFMNVPLWFLTCLFVTEILFFFIYKLSKGKQKNIILNILLFSVIGYLYSKNNFVHLPWNLDVSFTAVVFYGAGFMFKQLKIEKKFRNFSRKKQVGIFFLLLIISTSLSWYIRFSSKVYLIDMFSSSLTDWTNGIIDLSSREYNDFFLFYLVSFSGILWFIIAAQYLKKIKFFCNLGTSTIIIMSISNPILIFLMRVFVVIFGIKDAKIALLNPGWAILYTLLTFLIMFPVIDFIKKYAPFIIGKKNDTSAK